MAEHDPWFIEERAIAYVSLVLTKRNEVTVKGYAGRHMAIDLLIEILKDGADILLVAKPAA